MNHLLAVLSTNGEDSDYLRIIYELLIDEKLINMLRDSRDGAIEAKVNLLQAVIVQWGNDTAIDESED